MDTVFLAIFVRATAAVTSITFAVATIIAARSTRAAKGSTSKKIVGVLFWTCGVAVEKVSHTVATKQISKFPPSSNRSTVSPAHAQATALSFRIDTVGNTKGLALVEIVTAIFRTRV